MSQFFQGVTAGSLPPSVATQYDGDSGTATPASKILNVIGGSSSDDSDAGIQVTGSGDTLTVELTNILFGTASTSGAVSTSPVSFALPATAGTYALEFKVAAFDSATPSGASFSLFRGIRTDGATATAIGATDKIKNAEAAISACDADVTVTGNSIEVEVTGVAGLDINWKVDGEYIVVGA